MGTKIKAVAVILICIGIVLLFFFPSLGLLSIIFGIAISIIQHFFQKRSDEQRHKEYIHLALMITESAEAQKKIQALKDLMKKKNISIKRLIEKFDKPIHSIFIYKFNEAQRGKKDAPKPLKKHIEEKLKFMLVSNSFYILPPKDMPKITESFDLEAWAQKNIISKMPENATYTLNFVALVDLTKVFCFKTVDWGRTVFDVLARDHTFLGKLIESLIKSNIALSDIIKDYGLGDIITLKINKSIIKKLNEESAQILKSLNCTDITEICDVPPENLNSELANHMANNLQAISDNLIQNSKSLKEVSS